MMRATPRGWLSPFRGGAQHVRATGRPWTFLRMALYMDVIPTLIPPDGVIRGPAGDGRLAPVLRDDVAAAIVAVLTTDGHDGRTYDLTGPATVSFADIAALAAQIAGRPVSYVRETEDEAYASRSGFGAPEWEVRGWVSSYLAVAGGAFDVVSPGVRDLTGHEPTSVQEYLAAHPEALDHVGREPLR